MNKKRRPIFVISGCLISIIQEIVLRFLAGYRHIFAEAYIRFVVFDKDRMGKRKHESIWRIEIGFLCGKNAFICGIDFMEIFLSSTVHIYGFPNELFD